MVPTPWPSAAGVPSGGREGDMAGLVELPHRAPALLQAVGRPGCIRVRQAYDPCSNACTTDMPAPGCFVDLEQIEQLAVGATDRAAFLAELALYPPRWTR